MPIFLGVLAAVFIGISDWLGSFATRRSKAITTVSSAMIAGFAMVLVLTFVVSSHFVWRDFLLGAGSGLFMGLALMLLYRAIATSSAALASPISSGFVAVFPLGWDLATGGSVSGWATIGIPIAVGGVVLTTFDSDVGANVAEGVKLAVASGLLFGLAWVLVGRTSLESGLWSAVSQRGVALVVMMTAATVRRVPRLLPKRLLGIGLASGAVGGAGVASYIAGTQRGSLGSVAVASSMFPVITVMLTVAFEGERLRPRQIAGIAASMTGIALVAAG